MPETRKIIVYGTTWCGDSRRAKRFFDDNNIEYEWIDIDVDREAGKLVEQINGGFQERSNHHLPGWIHTHRAFHFSTPSKIQLGVILLFTAARG